MMRSLPIVLGCLVFLGACAAPEPDAPSIADNPLPEIPDEPMPCPIEDVPAPGHPDPGRVKPIPDTWLEGSRSRFDRRLSAPPPLIVETPDAPFRFGDHRGRVVLVVFWANWSQPSLRELRLVEDLRTRHPELAIVAVGATRGGADIRESASKLGLGFPVAVDVEDRTANAYRVDGYPDYYLVDKWGRLRVADLNNDALAKAVELLLSE